jgi:hypothetical protein
MNINFFESSAKTGHNVEYIFMYLANCLILKLELLLKFGNSIRNDSFILSNN